jgi:hypothetical protein
MVPSEGFEPPITVPKTVVISVSPRGQFTYIFSIAFSGRLLGIEPKFSVPQTDVLTVRR